MSASHVITPTHPCRVQQQNAECRQQKYPVLSNFYRQRRTVIIFLCLNLKSCTCYSYLIIGPYMCYNLFSSKLHFFQVWKGHNNIMERKDCLRVIKGITADDVPLCTSHTRESQQKHQLDRPQRPRSHHCCSLMCNDPAVTILILPNIQATFVPFKLVGCMQEG